MSRLDDTKTAIRDSVQEWLDKAEELKDRLSGNPETSADNFSRKLNSKMDSLKQDIENLSVQMSSIAKKTGKEAVEKTKLLKSHAKKNPKRWSLGLGLLIVAGIGFAVWKNRRSNSIEEESALPDPEPTEGPVPQ